MNKKILLPAASLALALIISAFFAGRYSTGDPSNTRNAASISTDNPDMEDITTETQDSSIWTCSMHPQIQQPEPGDCPICGMDLIPLDDDDTTDTGPRTLTMSESAHALAEIQVHVVERRFPEAIIRLVGKLDYDETKVKSLTARFPARIDKLYVNFTGVAVKKREHLALIYSPELLTAQSELLTAYSRDPEGSITKAAREKLRLWDLLPEQIESIVNAGAPMDHFELKAPISGVVVSKNVNEGDYIKTGQSLFTIVDLSELWLNLNAYESDLTWLRYGQKVEFSVESYPGEIFSGTITFINPELDRMTRTIPIRVNVPNSKNLLKPGMFAKGLVHSRIARSGQVYAPELAGKWISPMHPEIIKEGPGTCDVCGMDLVPVESMGYALSGEETAPLVIPSSAVLRTGKRAVVYVKEKGRKQPTFTGREIVIGARAGDSYIVREGLKEGDQVVTNGAFKIDSALQIKARPSMMNPQGDETIPGHNHVTMNADEMRQKNNSTIQEEIVLSPNEAREILNPYFELHRALAGDNLVEAKSALKIIMKVTGHSGPAAHLIHQMLTADDLDTLRKPGFDILSSALIMAVKDNPENFAGQTIFRNHCPMVYEDHGAEWLQNSEELLNPYFGDMMLYCGEVVEKMGSGIQEGKNE